MEDEDGQMPLVCAAQLGFYSLHFYSSTDRSSMVLTRGGPGRLHGRQIWNENFFFFFFFFFPFLVFLLGDTCGLCHRLMPLTILQVGLSQKNTLTNEEKKRNKIDRVETSTIEMRQLPMSHVTERSRGPRDPPSDVK